MQSSSAAHLKQGHEKGSATKTRSIGKCRHLCTTLHSQVCTTQVVGALQAHNASWEQRVPLKSCK